MNNIKTFDMMVGLIFGELYENFPICKEINLNEFLSKYKLNGHNDELILSETLFWLRDSGFLTFLNPVKKDLIRFEGVRAFPQFSCVVLSARGLETLKNVPKSIDSNKGLGELIIESIKKEAPSKLTELVGFALARAIGA